MGDFQNHMHLSLNVGAFHELAEEALVCATYVIDDMFVCGQVAESSAISSGNSDTGWPLCIHGDIPFSAIVRQSACAEAREDLAILGVQQVASHAQGVQQFGTSHPVTGYPRFWMSLTATMIISGRRDAQELTANLEARTSTVYGVP
jgi:hypothetical protein